MLIDEINSVLYIKKVKHNFLVVIILNNFENCCLLKSSIGRICARFFIMSIIKDCETCTAFHILLKFIKIFINFILK